MNRYVVHGDVMCMVSVKVFAENPEKAMKKVDRNFGGIHAFVGNGGLDKIIGVCADNEAICCDDDVDWGDCILIEQNVDEEETDEDYEDDDDDDEYLNELSLYYETEHQNCTY